MKTKITIKTKYGKYSVSQKDEDLEFSELVELFKQVALASGYHYETIKSYFDEK